MNSTMREALDTLDRYVNDGSPLPADKANPYYDADAAIETLRAALSLLPPASEELAAWRAFAEVFDRADVDLMPGTARLYDKAHRLMAGARPAPEVPGELPVDLREAAHATAAKIISWTNDNTLRTSDIADLLLDFAAKYSISAPEAPKEEHEPGELIAQGDCPCCGNPLKIEYGDDEEEIRILGLDSKGFVRESIVDEAAHSAPAPNIDDLLLQEIFSLREKLKIAAEAIKADNPDFDTTEFLHQCNSVDLDQLMEEFSEAHSAPAPNEEELANEIVAMLKRQSCFHLRPRRSAPWDEIRSNILAVLRDQLAEVKRRFAQGCRNDTEQCPLLPDIDEIDRLRAQLAEAKAGELHWCGVAGIKTKRALEVEERLRQAGQYKPAPDAPKEKREEAARKHAKNVINGWKKSWSVRLSSRAEVALVERFIKHTYPAKAAQLAASEERVRGMRETLESIAKQYLPAEAEADGYDHEDMDFEYGYKAIVEQARAALSLLPPASEASKLNATYSERNRLAGKE